MTNRNTSAPVGDPVSIDVKRSTAPKDANSPRLLGTLWWSEKSGGLFIRQRRRMQRKWLGLTGQEWGFFAGVAGLAFAAGLAVLKMWG